MKVLLWLTVSLWHRIVTSGAIRDEKCVGNAIKNEAGQCECRAGFVGNGRLCCLPDDHKLCMLEGDPLVRSMNGDLLPVDLPCATMITEVHTMGADYDETVHVYTAGDYGLHGVLQFTHVNVSYREQWNDIHTNILIADGQITIDGIPHDKKEAWSGSHHSVTFHYTPVSDTYAMMSMGATMIYFVPPGRDTDLQRTIPGTCVGVTRDSLIYDRGMCNERRRSLTRSSVNKGFQFLQAGVVEHVIRNIEEEQNIGPAHVQDTCRQLKDMRRPCGDKWNPAIAACYVIVSHSAIRYCLTVEGLDILHVFHQCTSAHCAQNQDSCAFIQTDPVKKCIDVTPDCSLLY